MPASASVLRRIRPVRALKLTDLHLEYRVPGASVAYAEGRYENLYPDYAVDGIRLKWVTDCTLRRISVDMAGRHPLNLDGVGSCVFDSLVLKGSWNKGKGGNGYLRIARSHHNVFQQITVEALRHLTLQWGSSFNRMKGVRGSVDINFHGGFSHHNEIDDVRLIMPADHPWPSVYRTPSNASWAPPDGPDNRVTNCYWRFQGGTEWQRCE